MQKRSSHIEAIDARAAAPVGSAKYYDNDGHHVGDVRQIANYTNNATSHNPHRCSSKCIMYDSKRGDIQAGKGCYNVEVAGIVEDVRVLVVCGADDVAEVAVGHAVGRVVVDAEVAVDKVEL
ncbi:hypothetical protein GGI17_006687, partial [Coemansia sp. S146]